jgi:Acetyltransferase (GNAT) domain
MFWTHSYRPKGSLITCQRFDSLDKLADSWDLLAGKSGSPMGQFAWAGAWAETFAADYELHLVGVRGAAELTAIAPLVRRLHGGTRLELLSVNELFEPMDFLYATPAALLPLTDALARLSLPLFLQSIPADSPVVGALQRSYRGRGLVICRPAPGCRRIPLNASWIEPEQHLNPRRRSNLRRARRIAESMGPLSFEMISPTSSELKPLLEEAFQVEASCWKGRRGTALARDVARGLFFSRYAAAACQKGILRLGFLRIGSRAAAMQLGVECNGRFWGFKCGYDEAYAPCSPGTLLILETVRYAAGRGLRSFEFLNDLRWTQMWAQLVRPCISLRAYPSSLQGMAILAGDISRARWQRFDRVVQDSWRTFRRAVYGSARTCRNVWTARISHS